MLAIDIVNTANAKGLWGYAQARAIIFWRDCSSSGVYFQKK
jgi:hypothetical protein